MNKKVNKLKMKNGVMKNFTYNLWTNAVIELLLYDIVFFFSSGISDFRKYFDYFAKKKLLLGRVIFRYSKEVNLILKVMHSWDYKKFLADSLKFFNVFGLHLNVFFLHLESFKKHFLTDKKVSLELYDKFKFGKEDFIPLYFDIVFVKFLNYLVCPKIFSLFCLFCSFGFCNFLYFFIRIFFFFFNVYIKSSGEKR